ncbi:hypothetical protein [Saccharibacillus alkalitolerans]|uniref:Lipoprotein n=1 Tax=Saccharibacillus alkalitolerans TaxID=2705290 RepID=A0ABX0FBQ4_9BACL|nr:hypothetical protein [Saccharibacillus alkalitolerans]NGZ76983.1 hypothetical protein [Saccharibacillus alkalitolerans]
MKINGMRKWMAAIAAAAAVFSLAGCLPGGENAGDSGAARQIESDLHVIVTNPDAMASSNPGTYIEAEREAYDRIAGSGEEGLVYMTERIARSREDGLEEWILARACADMLGGEEASAGAEQSWETGKDWLAAREAEQK